MGHFCGGLNLSLPIRANDLAPFLGGLVKILFRFHNQRLPRPHSQFFPDSPLIAPRFGPTVGLYKMNIADWWRMIKPIFVQ